MPVWHVSIARISRTMDRVLPTSEWPNVTLKQARKMREFMLRGAGGEWEKEEIGEKALHLRRRLNQKEIDMLFEVKADCPVFTHGAARVGGTP